MVNADIINNVCYVNLNEYEVYLQKIYSGIQVDVAVGYGYITLIPNHCKNIPQPIYQIKVVSSKDIDTFVDTFLCSTEAFTVKNRQQWIDMIKHALWV